MSEASIRGVAHLVNRFFSSVRRVGPNRRDEAWAVEQLLAPERELWSGMSEADRRHGIAVATRVAAALGPQVTRAVIAAALLHDVGKTVSAFDTLGRVIATLAIAVAGRARAESWNKGFKRRIALYSRHPELGADLLSGAGSFPLLNGM